MSETSHGSMQTAGDTHDQTWSESESPLQMTCVTSGLNLRMQTLASGWTDATTRENAPKLMISALNLVQRTLASAPRIALYDYEQL